MPVTEKLSEGLYRIPVPLPDNPLRELNAWLLCGDDHSLLIDTGFCLPECRRVLEQGLAEIGADRSRLDVLATHIHTDHTGLSAEMAGPGRRVYIGEGDLPMLQSQCDRAFWEEIDRRFLLEGFPPEEAEAVKRTNPARNLGPPMDLPLYTPLKDGDILTVGRFCLQVIAVPGHTPGQVCLWMEREGILFTADHVLFDITPNIAMWPNLENALGRYIESLNRVYSLPVKLALPGHRHSGDFHARVRQLLRHHENRVAETLSIVKRYPNCTAYEIAARMTWDIRAKSWSDFPLNQKWFAVGEAIAHLELLIQREQVARRAEIGYLRYHIL